MKPKATDFPLMLALNTRLNQRRYRRSMDRRRYFMRRDRWQMAENEYHAVCARIGEVPTTDQATAEAGFPNFVFKGWAICPK